MPMNIRVNGKAHRVEAEADAPLLYVLRNDLELNGPKFGCGLGQCGSCSVLVGGQPVRACVYPVGSVGTQAVITVDSESPSPSMRALQKAFLDEQAAQCGYCTSGMLIASASLLDRNRKPSEDQIREALETHICRCGVHNRIVRAVGRAAKEMSA